MANTLKLRRSATAGSVPTTAQLALGELAMNTADGKLFMKTDDGAGTTEVVEIGSGGSITIASAPPEGADPGDIYWDQDDGSAYIYYDDGNGAAQWVPLTPLAESVIPGASADKFDDISGSFNGVLTDFTININGSAHSPLYQNATLISIGGVIQEAGTAYTISGSTISFTTAPAAGLDFFGIDLASPVLIGTPNDGTVTSAKLDTDLTIDLASGSATSPSITFDSNTGIYSPGADQVAISTGGTGRLFINSSGNVGIGTTNPGATLHIKNNSTGTFVDVLQVANNTTGLFSVRAEDLSSATSNWILGTPSGSSMVFGPGGGEKVRITSDGKLGLGTSSPSATLDVAGTSGTYPTQQIRHSNADTDGEFLRIARADLPGIRYHSLHASHGGGTNYLQFKIHDPSVSVTAQKTVLHLSGSGNVGIGTSNPAEALEVAGNAILDANNAKLNIKAGTTGNTGALNFTFNTNSTVYGGLDLAYDNRNTDGLRLFSSSYPITIDFDAGDFFRVKDSNTEYMRIDSSGRLGLGTSSPEAALHISPGAVGTTAIGGRDINYGANLQSSSGRSGFLVRINNNFTTDNDNAGFMWLYPFDSGGDADCKVFRSATGATLVDKFWVNQGGGGYFAGKVGIGTSTPDSIFEVRDDLATGIISRSTNTQATNTNKALKVRNNSDTDTFNVSYKGQGYFADSVGIGTTSPTSPLHISKGVSQLALFESSNPKARIKFVDSNSTNGSFVTGDGNELTFETNGSNERMRIDSNGRLLVGTSSGYVTTTSPTIQPLLQIHDTSFNKAQISINSWATGTDTGPTLSLCRSDSGTIGTHTVVGSADVLGNIRFAGSDGDEFIEGATITARADGTWGNDDGPTKLVFSTTVNGASSPTERMSIDKEGILYSVPTYNNTTGSTTNLMRIGSDGQMYRSTSSIAYKTDVEDMDDAYADAILNLRPVWYRSTCKGDNPNHSHWGFIAEEVEQVDPRLCSFKDAEVTYDEEGNKVVTQLDNPIVDGVDYGLLTPLLLNLIKRQKEQIEAMEARLSALEAS